MTEIAATVDFHARTERRRSRRHRLCLDAQAEAADGSKFAGVVHELSQSGFLLQANHSLAVGDLLQLELLGTNRHSARVVWSCGSHHGCQFNDRVSTAAISAALLKARPAEKGEGRPRRISIERPTDDLASAPRPSLWLILSASAALWTAAVAAVIYCTF